MRCLQCEWAYCNFELPNATSVWRKKQFLQLNIDCVGACFVFFLIPCNFTRKTIIVQFVISAK